MGAAEVSSFEEVRARKPWAILRQRLHERFDQWLEQWEERLPEPTPTFSAVTETIWALRQELTGGLPETMLAHAHVEASHREQTCGSKCHRLLKGRDPVSRTVETMGGPGQLERPYVSCRACRCGMYPRDAALGVVPGRKQLDVHKAAAQLVTEVPYDEAQTLGGDVTGVGLGRERIPTLTNHMAQGLRVLDGMPARAESEHRIASVAAGRFRRPVLVRGIDGA